SMSGRSISIQHQSRKHAAERQVPQIKYRECSAARPVPNKTSFITEWSTLCPTDIVPDSRDWADQSGFRPQSSFATFRGLWGLDPQCVPAIPFLPNPDWNRPWNAN